MDSILACTTILRDAEKNWWNRQSTSILEHLRESGLDPNQLAFFGEILFFLLGMKGAVIFTGLPDVLVPSYIKEVLEPSNIIQTAIMSNISSTYPVLARIHPSVMTQSTDFGNALILYNPEHHVIAEILRFFLSPQNDFISEDVLALALDYPVSLSEIPAEPDELRTIEVGYLDQQSNILLTSYASTSVPEHRKKVSEHFSLYQERTKPIFSLAIEIRQMSSAT
eukprot:TRINITY_DN15504_c0_g1::TRINITY_DN15504_c0_g1_i1::g.30440::m.30440 TRINITY_DN15504_c0_g1::TRINITY_DN15504_c0_g1_i1::g.30440  ORF type:complete len:224 (+),score=13.98 TRINITY_DN15504_c0_g1_i1:97-768(+)